MRTAHTVWEAKASRLLAGALLLAALLVALVPTTLHAQTATTEGPRLSVDASCSDGVLTIEGSGFQAEHRYSLAALPPGSDSGLAFGPERADADGHFRVTAPLALFDASCAQHTVWRFSAFDVEAPTALVTTREVTFGAPSPALAGFGVGREPERTHPAVIIALLTVSAAIIVSTITHRRGHTPDHFED